MKVMVPQYIDELDGEYYEIEEGFRILGQRNGNLILEFWRVPKEITWIDEFEYMYGQLVNDDTVKVVRSATEGDLKLFRIPNWIQSPEIPECCGKPMHFVGQIDDAHICEEAPADANCWWHDTASFYVFTCSTCLSCKAVGQQY